jgi:predicted nucleic acid-binding protein
MSELFADSFYFIARLVPQDQWHAVASDFAVPPACTLVTTEWMLVEVADALATRESRTLAGQFIERLVNAGEIRLMRSDAALFKAGLELYNSRRDKEWSLTNCLSFIVMRHHNIAEALTREHHFEQAGFKALLKL